MVPRKCHIEHAYESAFIYIADIADGNVTGILEEIFNRIWFP